MNEFLKILKEMKDECTKINGNCDECPVINSVHRCQSLDDLAYTLLDFPKNLDFEAIERDIKEIYAGKRW